MGLTSGIVDVGALYECFHGIYSDLADADFVLEKYHEIRSEKFHKVINPVSTANILRLFDQNPDTAHDDPFLKMCKQAETDKKLQEQFAKAAMALSHNFKQYYNMSRPESAKESAAQQEAKIELHHPQVAAVAVAVE
jgi:hypothetical protein